MLIIATQILPEGSIIALSPTVSAPHTQTHINHQSYRRNSRELASTRRQTQTEITEIMGPRWGHSDLLQFPKPSAIDSYAGGTARY